MSDVVQGRSVAVAPPDRMSKTERRYLNEIILPSIADGTYDRWWFEPATIGLVPGANGKPGVRYTPDFLLLRPDGTMVFVEVKPVVAARARQGQSFGVGVADKRDKLKLAAHMLPMFDWIRVAPIPKKHGGGWEVVWFSVHGGRKEVTDEQEQEQESKKHESDQ